MKPGGFRFLELPGEVRNTLYRHILVRDRHVRMPCDSLEISVQILRLCRQVFEEAPPILYGENFFHREGEPLGNSDRWDWPLRLRQHVRKISLRPDRLHLHPDLDDEYSSQLLRYPHLEEVEIHYRNMFDSQYQLKRADKRLKTEFRSGDFIIGSILTALRLVDVWFIETQMGGRWDRFPSRMRIKNDTDPNTGDDDDRRIDLNEADSSETISNQSECVIESNDNYSDHGYNLELDGLPDVYKRTTIV